MTGFRSLKSGEGQLQRSIIFICETDTKSTPELNDLSDLTFHLLCKNQHVKPGFSFKIL